MMRRDLFAAFAAAVAVVRAAPSTLGSEHAHVLQTRNIVNEITDAYDFVVVGGGLAGLVLGARLSEDANHTVLVLEAGGNGDEYRDRIDVPGNAYYKSLWPTPLNWDFHTVPQVNANNTRCEWPRGKVLGGSSAINGLYMNRPAEIEVNAWNGLLGDMDGAENWSWNSFFAAIKKSEAFSPPSDAIAKQGAITWDASSHGTDGPIHTSWPGYTFEMNGDWTNAAQSVGIVTSHDTYGGENWGAYTATSAINPANWTRSYSRTGYLDPLPPRANYDVLVNAFVTRLLFNSPSSEKNLTANAVEYSLDGGATKKIVKVKKEVILAGGTIGSPAVLLHSGVGPKDVLSAAGVEVLSELPGVGQHLQDHVSVSLQWNTDKPTAGSIYADGGSQGTDPVFLSYVNDAVAYVGSSTLFGDGVGALQSSILGQMNQFAPSDKTVAAGYQAIYNATASVLLGSPVGQVELLIGNNVDGAVRLGAALQHPYSHGRIYITSSNPMDYPAIDPGYLTHPADVQILREGLKIARRVGAADALKGVMGEEVFPGPSVQTDAEWDEWLRGHVFTEFHPSSTCAMLPLDQGGVVDANLRVYGLANVRVADASVPPIEFSAHLMSSTYGVAEQASNIIRAYYNAPNVTEAPVSSLHSPTTGGNSSESSTTTPSGESTSSSSSAQHNGANTSSGRVPIFFTIVASVVFGFLY